LNDLSTEVARAGITPSTVSRIDESRDAVDR
jgi:hypothetical protein